MDAAYFLVVAVTPIRCGVVMCSRTGAEGGLPCPSCALASARLFCALMKNMSSGATNPSTKAELRNAGCQMTRRIALTAAAQA